MSARAVDLIQILLQFIVFSRHSELELPDNVILQNSLQSALDFLGSNKLAPTIESVFVIGGGAVYEEALKLPQCTQIHLTWIKSEFECDAFFPKFEGLEFKEAMVASFSFFH